MITEYQFIAHGCNAQGVMASGVAKLIKEKYPKAFGVYRNKYLMIGSDIFGRNIVCDDYDKTIVNMVTQEYYGHNKNTQYVSYDAIASCMAAFEKDYPKTTLAMPMIGAGLGGGNWDIISNIIENELTTVQPVVYVL